jgi:RimJ/RimL family protein N-acetyltransferase
MAETAGETDRLILRSWDEADCERFYQVMNTPAVMKHLGGVQSPEQWREAFERLLGYQRDFGHTFWIVEDKGSRELLGFCGMKRVNTPNAGPLIGTPEIGWRLRESAWGRGIAKEAAIAALDLAFGRFGYERVIAMTTAANTDSRGLMVRLGMTRREELDFWDDRYGPDVNPQVIYSIDRADWPAARAGALAKSPAAPELRR